MKQFIQVNDKGLCIPRPTLESAQGSPGFNLVIQTDNQFTPRPIKGAWMLFGSADRNDCFWMAVTSDFAAGQIAERVMRQTCP